MPMEMNARQRQHGNYGAMFAIALYRSAETGSSSGNVSVQHDQDNIVSDCGTIARWSRDMEAVSPHFAFYVFLL